MNNSLFSTPAELRKQLECLEVIKVIKDRKVIPISYDFPSRVQTNSIYLVDMTGRTIKDLAADGNGCYLNMGTYRWTYKPASNKSEYVCIRSKYRGQISRKELDSDHLVVVKTYYKHSQYADFKRTIAYIEDQRNPLVNNSAIIAYVFDGIEHAIDPKPHGNSKGNVGYTRKKPTVLKEVAQKAKITNVREALEKHIMDNGGRAEIDEEVKPSPHQLYRFGRVPPKKDCDFQSVMDWAQDNPDCCRYIAAHPEPVVVLATDQQIADLKRFATGNDSDAISVDPTFNLGKFYVTPITYRNCFLQQKRNENKASFCGPLLIHFRKTAYSYRSLFNVLNQLCPELHELSAYGTDGEEELIKALTACYPNATHLRCSLHFVGNVCDKMKELGLSRYNKVMKEELNQLLTCNLSDFDEHFDRLTLRWEEKSSKMAVYLKQRKEIIRDNLHASNNNGQLFYTNASESINAKLKRFTNYKSSSLHNFINTMKAFFEAEVGSATDGYIGMSQTYYPAPAFAHNFIIGNWCVLSKAKKSQLLLKFHSLTVERALEKDDVCQTDFDIDAEDCQINVSEDILKCMYSKADTILQGNNLIMPAPSTVDEYDGYTCASMSTLKNHNVRIKVANSQILCDCQGHKVHKICAHAIAAGHLQGCLYAFIRFHRVNHTRKRTSMSTFTQSVNTSTSGRKANQNKRSRQKTSQAITLAGTNKKCSVDHEEEGLVKVCRRSQHGKVKTCYECKGPIGLDVGNDFILARKIYRTYYDKGLKATRMSFKKEWAYFHIMPNCVQNLGNNVHVCDDFNSDCVLQRALTTVGMNTI